ncbi:Crp/Fnr family transcriptional regulator [Niveibacterium sp. COAC-50]|uniref:Crp/Fnr family transcriptional regulator n=1 Tax=Niveibacterium sp. COAC-50 TaxID=2729384 RepID=UPI001556573E|nr:Crp/Fnr family transcriptional regulator [Niveibacterium sp. COAC-50]
MSLQTLQARPTAALNRPCRIRRITRGQCIYFEGDRGQPWQLVSGIVRLDRSEQGENQFASLALAGDLLGIETLLDANYAFQATALTECAIEPWRMPLADAGKRAVLRTLISAEQRAADLIAIRTGQPLERVRRLMLLLAGGSNAGLLPTKLALPKLCDMADITGLASETVCRSISELRRQGVLTRKGQRSALVSMVDLSELECPTEQ